MEGMPSGKPLEAVHIAVEPAGTSFAFVDGKIVLPPDAAERGGIQPVVHIASPAGGELKTKVGENVELMASAEAPSGGKIIAVEWDFDGKGVYPLSNDIAAEVSQRIAEAVFAALVDPLPDIVTAAPAGSSGNFALGGYDPEKDRPFVMYQISGGGYGGNADLKPYQADQFDASLEWYFAPSSIFNVAGFYKYIKNQITTSWEPGIDIGVPGYLFNIIRPINGDHAHFGKIPAKERN